MGKRFKMAITKKINFTSFKITKTLTISDNFINTFGLTPHVYLYFGTNQNSPSEWIDLGDLSGDKTVDKSGTYGLDYIVYGFFANELSQTQKEFLIQTANIIYNEQKTHHFNLGGRNNKYVVANMSDSSTPTMVDINEYPNNITFDSVASVKKATFNNSLYNCTISNEQAEYESGTDYSTTINASKGYYFFNPPYIQYTQGGIVKNEYFTQVDLYNYSISFNKEVDDKSEIKIIANSDVVKNVSVNVNYDLTSDIQYLQLSTILETDLPKLCIFTKPQNKEYTVFNANYYDKNNILQSIDGAIDEQNTNQVNILLPDTITFYPGSSLTFHVQTLTQKVPIVYHTSNVSQNIKPSEYLLDSNIELRFKANDGYFFNSRVIATYTLNGVLQILFAVLDNDEWVLTLHIKNVDIDTVIDVYAYAIEENTEVSNTFNGALTLYKITPSNMQVIASNRFKTIEGSNYDLGNYIKSLKRFFFDIPSDYASTIKLGNLILTTVAETISSVFIDINVGSFTINRIYNNENDFTDVDIYAQLKYCGLVKLDNDLFMGKTAKIIYKINLVTAECRVMFYDNANNNILYSVNANVSVNVPYSTLVDSDIVQTIENDNIVNSNLYKDLDNKIIIRNKRVIDNLCYDCNFTETLSNLSGYFEIDNINLIDFDCLAIEKEMVETELKKGVFLTNG